MANAAQIDYWNATAGPEWVRRQAFFDGLLAPFGEAAMDASDLAAGLTIVDVGCGCGTTTLELAGRVGDEGRVVGVDVSAPMLDVARRRAADAGLDATVELVQADAQEHRFAPEAFDRAFSRMGVMFFDEPVRAFANLRRALVPDGLMAFACWQALTANPWMGIPLGAMASVVTLPPPPPSGSPGPFAFGDAAHVRRVLDGAGWRSVEIDPWSTQLTIGGDDGLHGAVSHMAELTAVRSALVDVDEVTRTRALAAMRMALESHVDPAGQVRLPGAAWLVRARAT